MIRMTKLLSIIGISLLLLNSKSFSMQSVQAPALKFGYSEFAPYTFTDSTGQATGDVTTIVKNIVAESGREFVPNGGPNRRLFRSLVTDDIDLLMVVPFKNNHSHKLIFGDKAFDTLDMTIFWLDGIAPPITDLSQLRGKPIISIAGYSYGGIFREGGALEGANPFNAEDHPTAIKALVQNRASYLIAYKEPIMFYSDERFQADLRSYMFEQIPLVLSIRRNYPDAANVLKSLESRYQEKYPERFEMLNTVASSQAE